MSNRPNAFLGPTAPWMDEDDPTIFQQTLRSAAESLAKRLDMRATDLRADELDLEVVILECRRQIAEGAVNGRIGITSDLADLVWSLVEANEYRNRL